MSALPRQELTLAQMRDRLEEALSFISPTCSHQEWFNVLAGIHHALGDDGRDLARDWSAASEQFNESEFASKWRGLRHRNGGITEGSVFALAKQAGWSPRSQRYREPTTQELEALRIKRQERARQAGEAREKRQRDAARAVELARELLRCASPIGPDHPQIQGRQVEPTETLYELDAGEVARILGYQPKANDELLQGRVIVAPIRNESGLAGVELRDEAGRKTVPYGTAAAGAYWSASRLADGSIEETPIYIGEGVVSMLSAYKATGNPCIAARSCHNLPPVASAIRKRFPNARIVVLGERGNGLADAEEAARLAGAKLVTFDEDAAATLATHGPEAVRKALQAAQDPPRPDAPPSVDDRPEAVVARLWPQPKPIPETLYPVLRFESDLLPESVRDWVMDISDRLQCPPDFVAASVMVALGAVIGRRIGIRPQAETNWTEFPNLWACIVGRPSVMKSPAMEQGQAPIRRLAAKAAEAHKLEMEVYGQKSHVTKLRREAAEAEMRKRLKTSPNANVGDLAIEDPLEPQLKRYIANDTSYESLGVILQSNPNGVQVFRDELVSLLKTLEREDNAGARGFYLQGWAGNSPYTFDRITRAGASIDAVCISLLGSTQPGRLGEYIRQAVKGGAADDGLIQRFSLLVWPDTDRPWRDVDRAPNAAAETQAFEVFEYLDKLDPLAIGADQDVDAMGSPRGQPYLRLSPGALELFREWRQGHETKLAKSEEAPALISHLAKYRKAIPALALVLHLADSGVGPVSDTALLKALAWADYLESHARRAYASLDIPERAAARAIVERIRKGDLEPAFQARDVYRKGWAGLSDRQLVHDALELLADLDWLALAETSPQATGGRPTRTFIVNPEGLRR
jgi:putative DNA primase/helicase